MTPLRPRPSGYPIKLVRDNTPEIINASGVPGDLWYAPLADDPLLADDASRHAWLCKKLVEEVAEFVVEGGESELVDVYAVVRALEEFYSVDLSELLEQDPREGFFEGVMMYGRHDEFDLD